MPGARSTLPFKYRETHAILFSARLDEISVIYLNSINFRNVGMAITQHRSWASQHTSWPLISLPNLV